VEAIDSPEAPVVGDVLLHEEVALVVQGLPEGGPQDVAHAGSSTSKRAEKWAYNENMVRLEKEIDGDRDQGDVGTSASPRRRRRGAA
jgi:hypothetical protein